MSDQSEKNVDFVVGHSAHDAESKADDENALNRHHHPFIKRERGDCVSFLNCFIQNDEGDQSNNADSAREDVGNDYCTPVRYNNGIISLVTHWRG